MSSTFPYSSRKVGSAVVAGEDVDKMHIVPLGGGQEVGRSCILLQFKGRSIMFDCGLHPGIMKDDPLPNFHMIDDSAEIDLILITHFHIDHCAGLPYFTEKTNFRGRIFMTHATKAVMKLLLSDNLNLQSWAKPLYTEQDLQKCMDRIELVDYHQTVEHRGIRFTATAAGHVLGAAMFMVEIDGRRVLYTGDYSVEDDRHLIKAEMPGGAAPDVLIVESTFGITNLPSTEEREYRFTSTIENIVTRGGSCLIPVFALGRAQELLLILDEYWQNSPHLQNIPVFYASNIASKALRVYQTFVNMMNHSIRSMMDVRNPFKLRNIQKMLQSDFDTVGPCVVMASPGFLTSGISRHLLERWCDDERNGVVIAGYTIEGTMAHDLVNGKTEVLCMDNKIKPRRCQVETISFAAHVDFQQNSQFIRQVVPDNIILVHGGREGMKRLKDELDRDIAKNWGLARNGQRVTVSMPQNNQWVKLQFKKTVKADVLGSAASKLLDTLDNVNNGDVPTSSSVAGRGVIPEKSVLVTENFISKVVAADELSSYTSCKLGKITQRMLIPIPLGLDLNSLMNNSKKQLKPEEFLLELLLPYIEELFDAVAMHDGSRIDIHGQVSIHIGRQPSEAKSAVGAVGTSCLIVEWKASPLADIIADSVVGTLMQVFSAASLLRISMSAGGKRKKTCGTAAAAVVKEEVAAVFKLRYDSVSKKIKHNDVDPSKALPKDASAISSKSRLLLLQEMLTSSQSGKCFTSIDLNTDGDKLIFRGLVGKQMNGVANNAASEAFCYVLWSPDEEQLHKAVVHCSDDAFKEVVIQALKGLI